MNFIYVSFLKIAQGINQSSANRGHITPNMMPIIK